MLKHQAAKVPSALKALFSASLAGLAFRKLDVSTSGGANQIVHI